MRCDYTDWVLQALQEQMERLADRPLIAGERADAADHCLAGITRLSSEVKDASTYLPAYDQRTYAEVRPTPSFMHIFSYYSRPSKPFKTN